MKLLPYDPFAAIIPTTSKTVVWNVFDRHNRGETDSTKMVTDSTKLFVFGDNTYRVGKGGTAAVRDEPNAMGVVTGIHAGFASLDEKGTGRNAQATD